MAGKDLESNDQEWQVNINQKFESLENHLKQQDNVIKHSRKHSYGLGLYIAGIVQLSIVVATLSTKGLSGIQSLQGNFLASSEFTTLIAACILLVAGAIYIEKARKTNKEVN